MNAKDLKTFIEEYQRLDQKGMDWIITVPREINDAFFDNPLLEAAETKSTLLMHLAFGDLYDDISWFLYEWDPLHGEITTSTGGEYNIKNIDDYILYLINEGLVEA